MKAKEDYVRHLEKNREAVQVLVFDHLYRLVGIFRSVNQAGECTGILPQSISANCKGRTHNTGGLYFRHLDTDKFSIESSDFETLTLQDFDKMNGEYRYYKTPQKCKRERDRFLNKK